MCYGIGGVPNQVASSATAFYLQLFLLDVAQIPAAQVSLVLFGGKVSGAAADPVAGFFINRSRRTGSGRLMPWVLGCTPFIAVAYFFLWFLPPFTSLRGLWYTIFYCLFQALATFFQVPYTALTMLLTPSPRERDSVTAYRITMEMVGTLMGATVHGLIVSGAHGPHGCEDAALPRQAALSPDATRLYCIAAAAVALTYPVCSSLLCLGVKERPASSAPASGQGLSFLAGLALTARHPPYLKLVVSFLFISAAVQVEQSYLVLFCTHASRLHHHVQSLVLTILVSAVLSTPLWEWVLQRFGKRTSAFGIFVSEAGSRGWGAGDWRRTGQHLSPVSRGQGPGQQHSMSMCGWKSEPGAQGEGPAGVAVSPGDGTFRDLAGRCAHSPRGIRRGLCIWREHRRVLAASMVGTATPRQSAIPGLCKRWGRQYYLPRAEAVESESSTHPPGSRCPVLPGSCWLPRSLKGDSPGPLQVPCCRTWWRILNCSTSTARAWRPSSTPPTSSSPSLRAQARWASPPSVWSESLTLCLSRPGSTLWLRATPGEGGSGAGMRQPGCSSLLRAPFLSRAGCPRSLLAGSPATEDPPPTRLRAPVGGGQAPLSGDGRGHFPVHVTGPFPKLRPRGHRRSGLRRVGVGSGALSRQPCGAGPELARGAAVSPGSRATRREPASRRRRWS
uniref:Major facilitator superfamily domain containing 2B n=1 Tax=Oryctolagus cuniculus TaxID=9986 RepID=A0A5F9C3N1_RABIT